MERAFLLKGALSLLLAPSNNNIGSTLAWGANCIILFTAIVSSLVQAARDECKTSTCRCSERGRCPLFQAGRRACYNECHWGTGAPEPEETWGA